MRSRRWRRKVEPAAANHPFVAGGDTRLTVDSPATARKYGPKPGEGRQGPHYRSWGLDPGVRYRSGFSTAQTIPPTSGTPGSTPVVEWAAGYRTHGSGTTGRESPRPTSQRDTLTDLTTPATQALLLRPIPTSPRWSRRRAADCHVHSAIANERHSGSGGRHLTTVSAPQRPLGDAITAACLRSALTTTAPPTTPPVCVCGSSTRTARMWPPGCQSIPIPITGSARDRSRSHRHPTLWAPRTTNTGRAASVGRMISVAGALGKSSSRRWSVSPRVHVRPTRRRSRSHKPLPASSPSPSASSPSRTPKTTATAPATTTTHAFGLSICTPPPPDAEGNPVRNYRDGWEGDPSGSGINVYYFREPAAAAGAEEVTATFASDGTVASQIAEIDAGQSFHRIQFPARQGARAGSPTQYGGPGGALSSAPTATDVPVSTGTRSRRPSWYRGLEGLPCLSVCADEDARV